jgi:riboflavin-specific deaminase-like protein
VLSLTKRPYVLLSTAMSVDGRIDGTGAARLVLSGSADLDRVDAERAASDAVMVGAGTIRRDDPRLLVRSAEHRAARAARGLPEQPAGVTVTASGDLDPAAHFFTRDWWPGSGPEPERLVYSGGAAVEATRHRLGGLAEVIDAGDPVLLPAILADLAGRGVHRLMVEGGAALGSHFLTSGLVDELQLVIAPFFVGDPAAPRFADPGRYPYGPASPMTLAEARPVGDRVLLRYLLKDGPGGASSGKHSHRASPVAGRAPQPGRTRSAGARVTDPAGPGVPGAAAGAGGAEGPGVPDAASRAGGADARWLAEAIELSRRCRPSPSAFCVGAVLVSADGTVLARGFSRERDPHGHAEEAALASLDSGDPRLASATLYSSLEPCQFRASRPRSCADLIIAAGLRRVVIAWQEPPIFAEGGGAARLREAGITVVEIPEMAAEARAVNASVLGA